MKKQKQLGVNPGTASNRLVKDLLFKFLVEAGHVCFRCDLPLLRENFSIDHKIAWLDSDDPVGKFFDLSNVAFSHRLCNGLASKHPHKKYASKVERNKAGAARRYADPVRYARHLANKRACF